jgi:hypothetical protein
MYVCMYVRLEINLFEVETSVVRGSGSTYVSMDSSKTKKHQISDNITII